ncbi:lysophospholipid acyltransferase family protein [Tomitella gaofuii]|uniref:lysophospholipid acyltransferase family protein n=1 Tax=Tomitella gaofuii TaxID=2760083 RepID=UPI001F424530|nr:lysophospholipid acyltransferase family protein [Tomitella gaofuii]
MGPVIRWFARTRVIGELPEGPIVVAPNHLTEIDSLVLCASLPRRLTFVAKNEYFARGGAGAWLYGNLCRLTGQIPISRDGAESAEAALNAAAGILRSGGVWAIYPEGTRSPDGRLFRGRTGAMRVALGKPCSVVPVGIVGTRSVNRPGRRGWRRGVVEIRIGSPIDLTEWTARTPDPQAWRAATDQLMSAIQRLTGQEYVDRYPTAAERVIRDAA